MQVVNLKESVITYARKSPDDKEDTEQSIINQDKLFDRTCLEKNWKIVNHFYDRNISGSDRRRKGLMECIEYAKYHGIKIIVVKDQSRFMRDASFFRDTLINLSNEGIIVFSCMKNDYLNVRDLGTRILSMVDEQKVIEGQQYAEESMERLKSENKPIGRCVFGYNPIVKFSRGRYRTVGWKISPKQANIVKKVVEHHKAKKPLNAFLKQVRVNKSVYYAIIRNYENGIYHGYVAYYKRIKNAEGFIVRKELVKYKGNFEAIFDEARHTVTN